MELPRVHPAFKGKPYRYAYAVSAKPPCCADNALTKFDVELGVTKTWFEPGTIPTGAVLGLQRPMIACFALHCMVSICTWHQLVTRKGGDTGDDCLGQMDLLHPACH